MLAKVGNALITRVMASPLLNPAAARELRCDRAGGHPVSVDARDHLTAALAWLERAQDATPDDGVARSYSVAWNPDFESRGFNLAFSERYFWERSVVETLLSVKRFDITLEPKSPDALSRLTPEGLRGNYFNRLERDGLRVELASKVSHAPRELFGTHVLKFGVNVAHSSFTGVDQSLPVELLRLSEFPATCEQ